MEISNNGSWYYLTLYVIITALYFGACKVIRSQNDRFWKIVLGILGGTACYMVFPGYFGLLLLSCSFWLSHVIPGRAKWIPMSQKAVLITGCDTGFGNALAKLLKDMGVTVFAGVLDGNSPGAQELRTCESHEGSGVLRVLKLDVTDPDQIKRAYHDIGMQLGEQGLWGLVNNAGILGIVADAEIQPMTVYRHCLNVNFLGTVEMSQVFLPLIHRSRGRIVNVCSMAGDVAMPGFAAYGASKAALDMFSRVMRLELTKWGIKVAIIQPAGFKTNIFGSSEDWQRYHEEIKASLSQHAREAYGETYICSLQSCLSKMAKQSSGDLHPVLDDICHALMSVAPRTLYTPGQGGWLIPFLCRLCPTRICDFIMARLFQCSDCYPAGLKIECQ